MDNCTRLNETQRKTALLTLGAIAIAGILVCSVAVVLLVIFKLYKYFTHRLALYQVLAAMSYGFSLGLELAVFDYYHIARNVNTNAVMTSNPYILHQLRLLNGWHGNQEMSGKN